MTDKPTEGDRQDRPPSLTEAGNKAWAAMVEMTAVIAQVAADETPELEPWLATLEAIAECLHAAVAATRAPGISADDLIVTASLLRGVTRNLNLARERYLVWKRSQAELGEADQ